MTQPRTMHLTAATFTFLAVALLCNTVLAEEKAEIEYHEDVIYGAGDGEPLYLDWARPKKIDDKLTAIVYIHGGGWAAGNKSTHRDEVKAAAERGYFSASVGYRFAPEHRFPAAVEDCKCAIRWMRANADELGVDRQRIGGIGFSAGAHLVLMLSTMDPEDGLEGKGGWPDWSSKLQAGVSFYGPTNLLSQYPDRSRVIVENFMGGPLKEKQDALSSWRHHSPTSIPATHRCYSIKAHRTSSSLSTKPSK